MLDIYNIVSIWFTRNMNGVLKTHSVFQVYGILRKHGLMGAY